MTLVPQNRANLAAAASAAIAAREAERGRRLRLPRLPLRRLTGRTLALAAVGAALPVGVGAAVVVLVHDAPPPESRIANPVGSGPNRATLGRVPESLLSAYSRLGAAPSPAERDTAVIRRLARDSRAFGLDAGAARALTRIDGKTLWLVPGNGFVCLAVQAPAPRDAELTTGCNTTEVAVRDGVQANDGQAIYGVLPDGVGRIEVTDDDGFRHVEPVTRNAYVLRNVSATIRFPVGSTTPETFRVIGTEPPSSG